MQIVVFDGSPIAGTVAPGLCAASPDQRAGRFVWPQADTGVVSLSRAQMAMLLEGVDWRRPVRTAAQL